VNRKVLVSVASALALGLGAQLALAEDPPAQPPPAPAGTPLQLKPTHEVAAQIAPATTPSNATWAKIGAGLIGIGATIWLVRRRNGLARLGITERTLTVSARKSIGVRTELLIVDVDGQSMLLGVTPGSIQRLAILSDAPQVAPMERRAEGRIEPRNPTREELLEDLEEGAEPLDMPAPTPPPRVSAMRPAARLRAAATPTPAATRTLGNDVEEQIRGLLRRASTAREKT
jgi:flagellar biogenesis protein FliO